MSGSRTRLVRLVAAAAAVLTVGLLPAGAGGANSAAPAIEALSTLPQYVSGGDVLVEIRLHDDAASLKHLRIEANGRDVSGSFRTMPDGSLRGLVERARPRRERDRRARQRQRQGHAAGPLRDPPSREPPPQRAAVLRPAAGALLLRDGPERPRGCARRRLLRTDAGALPLPDDRRRLRGARRSDREAGGSRQDDDARRQDRRLHRSDREGRDRPRRLRDRRSLRPGGAAEPVHGRARLERTARLHVRRRLQRRLPPGPGERRRAHRPLPRAWLRRRVVVAERLRQQLQ